MYSAAGGILSFISMIIIKEVFKENVSIVGVSSAGAIFHNVGQLIIASSIVKNIGVMLYLPILSFIGIGTGIFVGIAANYVVNHLKKLPMFKI
jgi:heptaprenyl diphosphate synthase